MSTEKRTVDWPLLVCVRCQATVAASWACIEKDGTVRSSGPPPEWRSVNVAAKNGGVVLHVCGECVEAVTP